MGSAHVNRVGEVPISPHLEEGHLPSSVAQIEALIFSLVSGCAMLHTTKKKGRRESKCHHV